MSARYFDMAFLKAALGFGGESKSRKKRSRSALDSRVMDSSANRLFDAPLRVRRADVVGGWICTTTFALANFLGSLIRASVSAVRVNVVGTIVVLSIGGSRHGS